MQETHSMLSPGEFVVHSAKLVGSVFMVHLE